MIISLLSVIMCFCMQYQNLWINFDKSKINEDKFNYNLINPCAKFAQWF